LLWNESLTFATLPSWNACLTLIEYISNQNSAHNTSGSARQPQSLRMGHSFICSTHSISMTRSCPDKISAHKLPRKGSANKMPFFKYVQNMLTTASHHASLRPVGTEIKKSQSHSRATSAPCRWSRYPRTRGYTPRPNHSGYSHNPGTRCCERALLDSCSQVNFIAKDFDHQLRKTIFGWVVSGRTGNQGHAAEIHSFLSLEDSINLNLKRLWRIEEISTTASTLLQRNRNANQCSKIGLSSRGWPWTAGRSFEMARLRFSSLERCLSPNTNLLLSKQGTWKSMNVWNTWS